MNKKSLTEADIRTKFILPAIVGSKWDVMSQIHEETYFTKGRVIDALIDSFYLQRYMLSESFLVQAVKSDTRVAMPKINQMELNAIAVPVPPLAE
ncbi:MAG: hypothetical protein RL630_1650 [Verrucomicrobiota bacterium]|jgi:hypothetical protein